MPRARSVPQEGHHATVFARVRGKGTHITVYPTHGLLKEETRPPELDLKKADHILENTRWKRTQDWRELEPGVFVSLAVKA